MSLQLVRGLCIMATVLGLSSGAHAITILTPGDPILAIDVDEPSSNSSYPGGEPPSAVLDGDPATKYLNFAGPNTGFIVTPALGPSQVQSMVFTTANDAPGRDPTSWELFGTNDTILSTDNSDGLGGESWTLIDSGPVALPDDRFTVGPVVPVANPDVYSSYMLIFPTLKTGPLMQIADTAFFQSNDGTGTNVLAVGDSILAVHRPTSESRYPAAEGPANAIDGDVTTKYLNFGRTNSGFIVTPQIGPSVVRTIQITTANDFPERDPSSFELYGTNDSIASTDNSRGLDEDWTLIASGSLDLPLERFTPGPFVIIDNDTAYASYRMIFPTMRDPEAPGAASDSIQFAEIQFFSVAIPEPGTFLLAALALLGVGAAGSRPSRAHAQRNIG